MATLQTQYKNFLKSNPDSKLTYDEWLDQLSKKLGEIVQDSGFNDWDVTLMDGLENEPYISDNFQIGPDGAFELSDREIDFQNLLKSVSSKLKIVTYNNGDISDLGNEIGIAVGTAIKNMTEDEISQFISGFVHGVSLTNGTH